MDAPGAGSLVGDKADPLRAGPPPPSLAVVKADPESKKKWLQLSGHQGEVFMCTWNPMEKILASGSADGVCRLWGVADVDASKLEAIDTTLEMRSSIECPTVQGAGSREVRRRLLAISLRPNLRS